MKYSHTADLTLPESSLSMSAKDFARLLIQRAHSQGAQLTTYDISEKLGHYAVISSNPELDALHEASLEERRITGLLLAGILAACAVIGLFFYIGDKYGFIALLAAIVIIPILIAFVINYINERVKSR